MLLPARLHDGVAEIVLVKQGHDLDAGGGFELPDELRRQLGGFPAGDAHGPAVRSFDIRPNAPRDELLAEDQDAAVRWATKASKALGGRIEVRAFQDPPDA